jgi:hypothetical protein
MKKRNAIKRNLTIGVLGILFLVSCGPRRYGCGPNRRCEINNNIIKTPIKDHSIKSQIQNT